MKRIFTIIFTIILWMLCAGVLSTYADVTIPGTTEIINKSIGINQGSGNADDAKNLWLSILWVLRTVVSWIALIYMVMIGVYMVIGSDSEDTVKTQRKQIIYALIGFLFLNIPSLVYTVFSPEPGWASIGSDPNWSNTYGGSLFWNTAGFEGIIGNLIAFLRVFVFGVAVTMFTWGLFSLIVSGGDDERRKKATNRIIYGIIGLIFMWFVELWGRLVAAGDFTKVIPNVSGTLFSLVMYFAAPISIFMIAWGAYYFITSAGDEERMKKGKSILINTGIALIILLSALSFITELTSFQL
jgi:hypothetical protein